MFWEQLLNPQKELHGVRFKTKNWNKVDCQQDLKEDLGGESPQNYALRMAQLNSK